MGFQCTAAIGITTRFPIYCYISCRPHSSSVFCVSSILCGTLKKKYLSNLCPPLYLALVWFSHHTTTPPSPPLSLSFSQVFSEIDYLFQLYPPSRPGSPFQSKRSDVS